ncbi:MAG: hypothetical protein MJ252_11635 [archaeon]|nr:hypothetical protein [archaeon]
MAPRPTKIDNDNSNSNEHRSRRRDNYTVIVYKLEGNKYSLIKPSPVILRIPKQIKDKFPFKNKKILKEREMMKIKGRTPKSYGKEIMDSLYEKEYQDLEAPISKLPKKKFCDLTGLETNYSQASSGVRFYDAGVSSYFQKLTQPIIEQHLNLRKALIKLQ